MRTGGVGKGKKKMQEGSEICEAIKRSERAARRIEMTKKDSIGSTRVPKGLRNDSEWCRKGAKSGAKGKQRVAKGKQMDAKRIQNEPKRRPTWIRIGAP